MEIVTSRRKLFRRFLPAAMLSLLWTVSLDLAFVAQAECVRFCGGEAPPLFQSPVLTHLFPGLCLLLVAMGFLAIARKPLARIRIKGDSLSIGKGVLKLEGPTYWGSKGRLVVTTEDGPVALEDVFDRPLDSIRNAQSVGKRGEGTLREYGRRWHISSVWWFFALFGAMFLMCGLDSGKRPPSAPPPYLPDALFWMCLGWFLAGLAIPGIGGVLADPTRRFERWIRIDPHVITVSNDGLWVLPTRSIVDVFTVLNSVVLRCRNGTEVRFPDASLEVEIARVCGLPPNRYITVAEFARLLGCSKIRAILELTWAGLTPPFGRDQVTARFPSIRRTEGSQ